MAFSATASEPTRYEYESIQMAVPVRIVLHSQDAKEAKAAAEAGFQTFARLNAVMSDYDAESELSRLGSTTNDIQTASSPFDAMLGAGPIQVGFHASDDLFSVLQSAKHFSDISNGAFDVTVGPLTRLWRRAKRQRKLPEPFLLEQAKKRVGNQHWELDEATKTVILKQQGMRFDLGGIAKGYAIDRAFDTITALGFDSVLVDAGGDFRLGKAPLGGWNIDIDGQTVTEFQHQTLENVAMATSGDSRRFVLIDGVRYSHIIDPQTGLGLTQSSTVRVLAPTATEADALASALSVMKPEQGQKLLATQKGVFVEINECLSLSE